MGSLAPGARRARSARGHPRVSAERAKRAAAAGAGGQGNRPSLEPDRGRIAAFAAHNLQVQALAKLIAGHPVVDVGMRNWKPFIPEAVRHLSEDGVERVNIQIFF